MADHIHLITEQDIHAYIDGELSAERRAAVEAWLAKRHVPLDRAAAYLRTTVGLRSLKAEIYRDRALRDEVDALLAKRRRGKPQGSPQGRSLSQGAMTALAS